MSTQLHTALSSILKMSHYVNEAAKSGGSNYGHEKEISKKLLEADFKEVSKKTYPKVTKTLLKKWAETRDDSVLKKETTDMPEGTFIIQPGGTNGFPDFLVKDFGGRLVALECKSTESGDCPMWNDNLPKPETIYILSSGKENQHTVFLGRDVITPEQSALIDEIINEVKLLIEEKSKTLSNLDRFNRGFVIKSRPQHFQYGGKSVTNYFTHIDRNKCEQNVLEFTLL